MTASWNAPDDLVVNVMEGDPVEDVGTYTRILYEVVVEAVEDGSAVLDKDGYVHGEEARATATPDEGYVFVNWTENEIVVSVDAEYAFTVTNDRNLRANFVEERPILFLVSLAAHPPQGGNVLFAPEGRQAGDYYAFFEPETAVTLTAQAESGWHFENWTEAGAVVEGAGAEYSFETPDAHRYLTATFAEVQPIPTLSEWGMIILAGLLLLFGAFRVHTRQRPDVS